LVHEERVDLGQSEWCLVGVPIADCGAFQPDIMTRADDDHCIVLFPLHEPIRVGGDLSTEYIPRMRHPQSIDPPLNGNGLDLLQHDLYRALEFHS
jgi:hypothetical protein